MAYIVNFQDKKNFIGIAINKLKIVDLIDLSKLYFLN